MIFDGRWLDDVLQVIAGAVLVLAGLAAVLAVLVCAQQVAIAAWTWASRRR